MFLIVILYKISILSLLITNNERNKMTNLKNNFYGKSLENSGEQLLVIELKENTVVVDSVLFGQILEGTRREMTIKELKANYSNKEYKHTIKFK